MDRDDKRFLMELAIIFAYGATAILVLLWLGLIPTMTFFAVTSTLAALGFYGSILEGEKKHDT